MLKESDIFRNLNRALLHRSAYTNTELSHSCAHIQTFNCSSTVTTLLLDARTLWKSETVFSSLNYMIKPRNKTLDTQRHCTKHDWKRVVHQPPRLSSGLLSDWVFFSDTLGLRVHALSLSDCSNGPENKQHGESRCAVCWRLRFRRAGSGHGFLSNPWFHGIRGWQAWPRLVQNPQRSH